MNFVLEEAKRRAAMHGLWKIHFKHKCNEFYSVELNTSLKEACKRAHEMTSGFLSLPKYKDGFLYIQIERRR